jgi:transcriptional regulator with XRE-family HTH domain
MQPVDTGLVPKNEALSAFLTAKRAAVTPAQVGITVSGPRRVPGLRREEVAFLAGVSVDWYIRLEQGREVTPSESVLAAIARILQLDTAERDYLINLARPTPGIRTAAPSRPVRPGIVKMINAFDRQVAFVLGPGVEVLAGNELAWALLGDLGSLPPEERNLLRWILLEPTNRDLYRDWAVVASDMVGVLQLEASAAPNDPRIAAIVGELATRSAEFRTWWSAPHPKLRTTGTKRFRHSIAGEITVEWEAFTVPDSPGQTLFVYTAADQASEEALRILASWRATKATERRVPST